MLSRVFWSGSSSRQMRRLCSNPCLRRPRHAHFTPTSLLLEMNVKSNSKDSPETYHKNEDRDSSQSILTTKHTDKIDAMLKQPPELVQDIDELLSEPSWSIASLETTDSSLSDTNGTSSPIVSDKVDTITPQQLHHLLRLSALPMPESPAAEADMIRTLQAQLQFVRAVQAVDTTGVEPLAAIRDETAAAKQETEISTTSLRHELDREELVGFTRRIRRKSKPQSDQSNQDETFDPLPLAPQTFGRYIALKGPTTT